MAHLTTFEANPHYWPDDLDDDAAERAEVEANSYFRSATKGHKAWFDQRMLDIAPYAYSPRWERDRASARKIYADAVRPYVDLMPRLIADILATGEMSEETQDAWDGVGREELRKIFADFESRNGVWRCSWEIGPVIPFGTIDLHLDPPEYLRRKDEFERQEAGHV